LLANQIKNSYGDKVNIFGPSPAFYERLNGEWRWQIIIKSAKRETLCEIIKMVPNKNWQYDIDPASLLQ
jgi:primosomal protein N' (replication factor Y) (superfamily II helicase)